MTKKLQQKKLLVIFILGQKMSLSTHFMYKNMCDVKPQGESL
jgi:hypothetical protein